MTTTAVSLNITCPDWCIVSPDEHVTQLWDYEGTCIHSTAEKSIEDHAGHRSGLDPVIYAAPILVTLTTQTRPDGVEAASPSLTIHAGDEQTISQALRLADEIRAMVAAYRENGGKG